MEICVECGKLPSAGSRGCKRCHAAYMRETRRRHADLTAEQRVRANCRSYANVYQRRGKILPQPCHLCGTTAGVVKHHHDYRLPLVVTWVCRTCRPLLPPPLPVIPIADRWEAALKRFDERHQTP